jgi:nicotinamidase-related amidase
MTDVCLLIVDVQRGFISESTAHIPGLVQRKQHEYQLVVATQFVNLENSLYRTLIKWDRFAVGSRDVELAFELKNGGIIYEKNTYSCINSQFLEWIAENNVKRVDVCGMDTDICVTKCAVDLFDSGIEPVVLENFCASNAGDEAHSFAIRTLKRYIGVGQVR